MILKGARLGLAGSVLLLPALVLTVPRGIGYAVLPMILLSLLLLAVGFRQVSEKLDRNEWLFILAFAAYPLAAALAMLIQGEWVWAHFDKPSRFLLAIPVFLAIRKFGASERLLYWGLIAGATGAGLFGYYQKYVQGQPVADGFTHKIPFGDISLMLGALAATCLVKSSNSDTSRLLHCCAVLALLFGLTGSFASGTRGGWIAIPFIAWLIITALTDSKKLRWSIFGLIIAGLVTVYSSNDLVRYKVDRAVTTTQQYFTEGTVAGSAGTRFEMWRGAWIMFTEHPWSGGGKDSYGPRLEQLIQENRVDPGRAFTHAHNDLLNLLAELGVLGGLSLIAMYGGMILFFARLRGCDLRLATAGLVLCFGYIDFSLTQAMFEHNISTAFLTFMLAILGGLLAHRHSCAEKQREQKPSIGAASVC